MKSIKFLALVMLTFSANVSYGQATRTRGAQDPAQQAAQTGQRSDDDVLAACCSGGAQCDASSPDIKAAVDRVLGRQAAPTTSGN
jgi:hypothetical protein